MTPFKRRDFLIVIPALGLGSYASSQSGSSPYPSKPIRFIVPVSAGGGADMIARATCERLGKELG